MKRTVVVFLLLLTAGSSYAQTADTARSPDYSRDTLLRLLADQPKEKTARNVEFGIGTISFRALGTRWRISYLPIFMPFPGSYVTTNRQWPDPFLLTGTEIASPPRTWRQTRDMSAELRRIERKTKIKAKVTAKPD